MVKFCKKLCGKCSFEIKDIGSKDEKVSGSVSN